MRLGLNSVHEIGELDGILDEEDWDVVPNDILMLLVLSMLNMVALCVPKFPSSV